MAKKKSVQKIKTIRGREFLRFKDSRGRFTKFDGRKKLIAEVWITDTYTDRKTGKVTKRKRKTQYYLNSISKKKPVPEKFSKKRISKMQRRAKAEVLIPIESTQQELKIMIDARYSIQDNLILKADTMLEFIQKNSRANEGVSLTCDFDYKIPFQDRRRYESFNLLIKGKKDFTSLEIAQNMIYRMYREKLRMSSIKDSPLGDRADYVRYVKAKFFFARVTA